MAFITSTIQQIFDNAIAYFNARLSQTTPESDQAYNAVLSGVMSLMYGQLLKLASDKAKEAITLSASLRGLLIIGEGRNIPIKQQRPAVLEIDVVAVEGTTIDTTVVYIGNSNGVRYRPDFAVIAGPSGIITLTVTALTFGTIGNLQIDDGLKADRQVSGANIDAVVSAVVTLGTNQENTEAYRQRLLDDERGIGGGSDSFDIRKWSEETPGVLRTFPYSGNPTYLQTEIGENLPSEKTVFVAADSTIDPDNVAPPELLDEVRDYIRFDPETGLSRLTLGNDANSTLYVESIFNTTFYVTIYGLDVPIDIEPQVKIDIEKNVKVFFRAIRPFILGLDFIGDKNDIVTVPNLFSAINDIVKAAGGTFDDAEFSEGGAPFPLYTPVAGEFVKLADSGGITYLP